MSTPEEELEIRPGMKLSRTAEINHKVWLSVYSGKCCICSTVYICDKCLHPGNPKLLNRRSYNWEAYNGEPESAPAAIKPLPRRVRDW